MTMPKFLLSLEDATVLLISLFAFYTLHGHWGLFALLILAPDIFMLGYLVNTKIGAIIYNSVHTYTLPLLLVLFLIMTHRTELLWLCAIWLAHIGMDRMLGYGLKYPTAFNSTHLQRV